MKYLEQMQIEKYKEKIAKEKCDECGTKDFNGYICKGCNRTNIRLWNYWCEIQWDLKI
ncbi:hypothetical protein LCGC14_0586640 [marine sediment metagenome]|uniref:Uncharacterized protein n=1 Tax=marine sediment metagenome TaxID=412755 RepID=A0A0F9UN72_9ZZZZ